MTRDEVEQLVAQSISDLLREDRLLLQNDVAERAITHKLAEYIQTKLPPRIPPLHVDCEYNRDVTRGRGKPKAVMMLRRPTRRELQQAVNTNDIEQLLATSTYPDIIVHQRGNNDENLLVIEVKKANNSVSHKHDFQKLEAFTENTEHNSYNFTYGVFILFETDCKEPRVSDMKWFSQGQMEK